MSKEAIEKAMISRCEAWQVFFNITELGQGDIDESIDFKKLWNQPFHPMNVTILYIYSLETFIPMKLNTASRDRDQQMVLSLGAFAMALKTILYGAN